MSSPFQTLLKSQSHPFVIQKVGQSVRFPDGSKMSIPLFGRQMNSLGFDGSFVIQTLGLLNDGGSWGLSLSPSQVQSLLSF